MGDKHTSFALSLSGGGFSSLAYAGFSEVLKQNNLAPSAYAGLSGGAVLSVLLASLLSTSEILKFVNHLRTLRVINTNLSRFEIIDHNKLIDLMRKLLPYKSFEELPTPAYVFATDLTKKEAVLLGDGDIASALVASCSYYPLLQPVKRRGLILGEGGSVIYYGAQYLHNLGIKKVIGIDVTGVSEGVVKGILNLLYKQINATLASNARYELKEHPVDLDIKINFPSPSVFNINKKVDHIIRLGRRTAEQNIAKIKKIITDL